MEKISSWYRRRRGDGPLVPIGLAIGGTLALALAIAAAVTIIGLNLLRFRGFKPEPLLSAGTLYDLLKVAFAVAAGIGGVIALVTAYRRQRVAELAHDLAARGELREASRLFNERFTTAAGQFGDDKPAVQLAGVYAMAGLADDWPDQRQTCVDVLCAYLRMPYEPDPGEGAPGGARQAFRALREVRHTVIRVITAHLQPDDRRAATVQDWRGLDFDFTGAVFDGGSFARAEFSGGRVNFYGAVFSSGRVNFYGTVFSGGEVSFYGVEFSGSEVSFDRAGFSGGKVRFDEAEFSGGEVHFDEAEFSGGTIRFDRARFSGGEVRFGAAQFSGGTVRFEGAVFSGGEVSFERVASWRTPPQFPPWTSPPPEVTMPRGR